MRKPMLSLVFSLFIASAASAQVFSTALVGANEPDGGDPDGTGVAVVAISGTTVNFFLTANNLSTITGAHIHRGSTGGIVVGFSPTFVNGVAMGSVPGAAQSLIDEIVANPSAFYVNVHSTEHPGGAIRGNLNSSVGVSGQESASACIPSDTVLCLGDRFKVEATWTKPDKTTGPGHVVKITNDTGYMWFFSSNNVEMTIKVLDACSFGAGHWVFASGLTNVGVTLKVTDTSTGKTRVYANSLGTAFSPIQDTSAFGCP